MSENDSQEIKARHQRAGFLWKLPMSKSSSSGKWQRRMFIAKDGFLLYYGERTNPNSAHFDTKPKGVIPLGGCKVEPIEKGPRSSKFGLKITHPDFTAGRMLVLAAEKEDEQTKWLQALNDCSRVTMENALLGDSMIEKLRAQGTATEKEKDDVMQKLQEQAMALKAEQEEKLKLQSNQEAVLAMAKEADERATKKEAEMASALAQMEARRQELATEAAAIEAEVARRTTALSAAASEYEKVNAMLSAARAAGGSSSSSGAGKGSGSNADDDGTGSHSSAHTPVLSVAEKTKIAAAAGLNLAEFEAVERRAAELEQQKLTLELEKATLEKSVREMKSSSEAMKGELESSEAARKRLQNDFESLNHEEGDLATERRMRIALEKKLQQAEDSLRRLDGSLRRSGFKLDFEVYADVKTLMAYFEERADEAKRDAQRIDIMKAALKAKRKYLMASAKVETIASMDTNAVTEALGEDVAEDDGWGDDGNDDDSPKKTPAVATAAGGAASGAGAGARKGSDASDDAWGNSDDEGGEEDEGGAGNSGSGAGAGAGATTTATEGGVKVATVDELGPLPKGWVKQTDEEGDTWYYNASTSETSWVRPNPDGTVPA